MVRVAERARFGSAWSGAHESCPMWGVGVGLADLAEAEVAQRRG